MTRFTLPDPVHATTLGEMLFMLSLARKQYREAVLMHFLVELLSTIPDRLPGLTDPNNPLKSDPKDPQNAVLSGFAPAER